MSAGEEETSALESAVRVAIDAAQKPIRELQLAGFEAVAVAFGKEAQFTRLKEERQALIKELWYLKSAQELSQLLARRSELLKAADALRHTDAPPRVKQFLDSARQAGAPVEELTPDIRDWLEAKGLLAKLRIILGTR